MTFELINALSFHPLFFASCLVCIKYGDGATGGDDNGDDVDSGGKPLLDLSSKK